MNLKHVMDKLDHAEFIRIHRSYVVPLGKVISLRNRQVELAGIKLPLGDRYEDEFREKFTRR
jgi:DNA-binding LytR/AlgR family response regulator